MSVSAPLFISIVTPSLNQGAFIEECIISAKDQLDGDAEHIVVDGGSTDETLAVLRRYPHVKWISEPDAGQANALNKGVSMSSGTIVGWLNADDAYVGDTLAIVRRFFSQHADVGLVYGYVHVIDERSRRIRTRLSPDFDFERLVRHGECYAQPTFFFRRDVFERVGRFDPSHRASMDYDLILNIGRVARVRRIPRVLGSFRTHPGSMSHSGATGSDTARTAKAIQEKYRPLLRGRPSYADTVHDSFVVGGFKILGRLVSLPTYLRYRLVAFTRGA